MKHNPPNRWIKNTIDRSLHLKVSLLIILPMVLILCVFVIYQYTLHRLESLKNLSTLASYNGQLIEQSLQPSWQASDFTTVQRTLDSIGQNPRFRMVYLLDATGRVIFSPGKVNVGIQFNTASPSCSSCHQLQPSARPSGVIITEIDGTQAFRSMQPILNGPTCITCHDSQRRILGELLTDISMTPFRAAFTSDLRDSLLLGLSTILISAIIVNVVLERVVINRLGHVANALADFGNGKRDLILTPRSEDEIGRLEVDFNVMGHQIQDKESANSVLSEELQRQSTQQQLLLKQLISAQEDERGRVARELHDELGQTLSGLALHLDAAGRFVTQDPERAISQLDLSREVISKTTDQIHELIVALRPSVLDDMGLVAALHAHGERIFKDSGVSFILDTASLPQRLPATIETVLYRTFQEALTNIVRHSGANQVIIRLTCSDGFFEGEVIDNGHGFDPEEVARERCSSHCMGLLGMNERITQCGGTLKINSGIGKGTHLSIRIPISEGQNG